MKKERHIAACLSSYKRFSDLQRQIYSMMDQSYPHLHLFVAAKGVTEHVFRTILLTQFKSFIEEGRLTLRLFPNKNQLSNFVDAIRDLDVSSYDLFLKIDDDDFYSPDYIKTINEFHDTIPQGYSSFLEAHHWVRYENEGFTILRQGFYGAFGATMVMSPQALELIMKCEQNPDQIRDLVPEAEHNAYGFTEDNLMHKIMVQTGSCNMAEYLIKEGINYHMIYQRGNTSVMRGGILSEEFWNQNILITQDPSRFEHIIQIQHPQWDDIFCIQGGRGRRINKPRELADILVFNETEIILKWDLWGQERFVKNEDAVFVLDHEFAMAQEPS